MSLGNSELDLSELDDEEVGSEFRKFSSTQSGYQPRHVPLVRRTTSDLQGINRTFSIDFESLSLQHMITRDQHRSVWNALWLRQPVTATLFHEPGDRRERGFLTTREYVELMGITSQELYENLEHHVAFRHPNLLLHMCSCVEPDKPFVLVSQRSLHRTLSEVLKDAPLTPGQICRGLLYLHAFNAPEGAVHGFLRPSTVLVNEQRSMCSLSQVRLEHQRRPNPEDFEQPEYLQCMAPELMTNGEFDKSTDVYAFGIMLWQLWMGKLPFHSRDPERIKRDVLSGKLPPLVVSGDVPSEIADLYERCTQADPSRRPDISQVSETLRKIEPPQEEPWLPLTQRAQSGRSASLSRQLGRSPAADRAFGTPPRATPSLSASPRRSNLRRTTTEDVADVSELDMDFMASVHDGELKRAEELLAQGARIDATNYNKRSALHIAASEGMSDMVSMLLTRGAQIEVRDRWGSTPLHDAKVAGHHEVALLLQMRRASSGGSALQKFRSNLR